MSCPDASATLARVLSALPVAGGRVLVAGEAGEAGAEVAAAVRAAGFEAVPVAWPLERPPGGPVAALVAPSAGRESPEQLAGALRDAAELLGGVPVVLHGPWATPLDRVAALAAAGPAGHRGGGPRPAASAGAGPSGGRPAPAWEVEAALAEAGFDLLAAAEVTRRPGPTGTAAAARPSPPPAPAPPSPLVDAAALAARWAEAIGHALDGEGQVAVRTSAHALRPPGAPAARPFLSVVLRTQGRRPVQLREALLCLAGQTDLDLEVLVVLHSPIAGAEAAERRRAVAAAVAGLPPALEGRARLLDAVGGRRGRPLNVGLAHARGRYVGFLDDDDLVTADWVEVFAGGAARRPGAVVRALTARQEVRASPGAVGYQPVSPFTVPYHATFDYGDHLVANQSPICSVALPRAVLEPLGLRFDETLDALEDWDLLLRTAPWCGVEDTGAVTSIYHYWVDGSGSEAGEGRAAWEDAHRRVLERLSARPLVAAPQVASHLVSQPGQAEAARNEAFTAAAERDAAVARLAAVERSRYWRATAPLRAAVSRARRLAGGLRPPGGAGLLRVVPRRRAGRGG